MIVIPVRQKTEDMTDRPGLIQKRLSPHRFVQIPSDDAVPTAAATTIGTGTGPGPGPGPGTGSAPDDVAIDIPLSSMSGRSGLTRTGARKASTGTGRGSGSAAFCRGAYEPPGFLTGSSGTGTGVGPNEKSGLGSAYAPVHRYGAGYGYGYVCGNGNGYGNDFRRRRSSVATVRSMGEPDGSSRLARCYKRIIDYSPVTKYMVYILPLATVLAVPIIVGVTVAKHVEIGGVRLYWFFTWVDVVWLALWVSKLVARCLPSIYRSLASVLSPGRKGHAKVLRALETPVAMVLWAGVAVVTFFPVRQSSSGGSSARQRYDANAG